MSFFWKKKPAKEWKNKNPTDIQEFIERRHKATVVTLDRDLVVDDNNINRDVLTRYLTKYGFKSDTAETGYDVLEMMVDKNYKVIWIDIKMPILDGYETVKYLRDEYPNGYGYKGLIVGVTGYADEESQNRCIEAGMDNILTKPYSHESILRLHSPHSSAPVA